MALVQETLEKSCEECGKKFEPNYRKRNTQRFCSRICYTASHEYLEYYRTYRLTAKWREYHNAYQRTHEYRQYQRRPENQKYQREYQRSPKRREWYRGYQRKNRLSLMNSLGGVKCLDCRCEDYNMLQFHHIDQKDGIEDRKRFTGQQIIRYYLKHIEEAKQKLQVLCGTCNCAKNRKY